MATNMSIIYVTAETFDEARAIAAAVVEERLAACANILGAMESVYHWQGKIERADEVALILKTRDDLVEKAIARVKELHSYSVPCAVAFPISSGNPDYLNWLAEETAS